MKPEDLQTSPAFWKMIQERRGQTLIPLAEVRRRLSAKRRSRSKPRRASPASR